jgi:hypothetical protein
MHLLMSEEVTIEPGPCLPSVKGPTDGAIARHLACPSTFLACCYRRSTKPSNYSYTTNSSPCLSISIPHFFGGFLRVVLFLAITGSMATVSIQQPLGVSKSQQVTPTDRPDLLASSPYLDEGHLLDLDTLDTQSRMLAIALTSLHTKSPDYAIVVYEHGLDLDDLLIELSRVVRASGLRWVGQDFYIVEFRSQLKPVIDNALLFKLDKESHREANTSGGLLKYWYGEPDELRRNLATCESPGHSALS